MRRPLFFLTAALLCATAAFPQRATSADVVNTLKERIQLTGYTQTGYTYDDTQQADNMFDIKRLIFIANGRLTDRWAMHFMYNFAGGGTLLQVYTDFRILPFLSAQMGQFKTPFSIEGPMSPTEVELIDCYSQATNYLTAVGLQDPLMGSTTGRDLGLMFYGTLGKVDYELAVMNGQGINVRDGNSAKDLVANLKWRVLDGWMVSASGVKGSGHAVGQSIANPDIQLGDNYTRDRWAVGTVLTRIPKFYLRSEYMGGKDGNVESEGFYVSASYKVTPKFDLVASYDYFDKNTSVGMAQTNYVAGVQYWFYPRCRLQAQYTYKDLQSGNGNMFQAQVQVRF
jgi:predicted porin